MKRGRSYGFFDCRASKEAIKSELPIIRKLTQTPLALELSLIEGPGRLSGDPDLMSIAKEQNQSGIRYVMGAGLPNASNKKMSEELSGVLNQAYQSPLYHEDEPFRGKIIFEKNGKYVGV